MLNGTDLGAAIKVAIEKKIASGAVASQAAIARHFNVKPPSIHDWIKKGSISKDKLPELWRYFSDVVGPDHWGLKAWPDMGSSMPEETPPAPAPWPFPGISEKDVRALPPAQINQLQGALALAIAQLRLRVEVADTAPQRPSGSARGSVVDTHAADDAFPMREVLDHPAAGSGKVRVSANVTAGARAAANDSFERVPELADVRLAAGDGIESHAEDQTGVIQFRRSFLRSVGADGGKARVVYAKGDSMEPVIKDGAALLVVPNENLTLRDLAAGGIYAINYDGKMIVKMLAKDKLAQRWVARSLNADYPDIPLENGLPVRVLGQVVWTGTKLRDDEAVQWLRS